MKACDVNFEACLEALEDIKIKIVKRFNIDEEIDGYMSYSIGAFFRILMLPKTKSKKYRNKNIIEDIGACTDIIKELKPEWYCKPYSGMNVSIINGIIKNHIKKSGSLAIEG